ncbi:cell wall-active antibiotics response protein LiaF [Priestia megaterium]|uniref:Cell wall-active antibiotics response protein n=1 Tax=Priestia megaterium TaxID=1404 RepID=A0A1I2T2P5_PRIMG|nr:cell wall-active antibiotics response protein LiaF [Priestia megaterium]KLV33513.1 cell wall-active antibiotics response protein [Priestia megaterium]MBY0199820.1 cell wall-active antibiotics response protein [Priestia megaterium]MCE4089779.1 cell wall-active antibiotics response protein LiaF [Priestia megaterium]MCR8929241.1 cell wall-active antibiotics response protein LiaF [Priestia megaterium]MDH3159986.1 cell wall-active antibiotics response protein LiaF [Priestia megaterium]
MQSVNKTESLMFIFICSLFVLFIEIMFFHSGLIFSVLIAGAFMYIGRKKMRRKLGRILFWIGVIGLVLNIFNTVAFKFLIIALFLYFLLRFIQSRKHPVEFRPTDEFTQQPNQSLVQVRPVLTNKLLGSQRTEDSVYEWDDINIQSVWGDIVVDLSNTVLPKGDAVIFIRQVFGNIKVLIPYETEVSVNHSKLAGNVTVFGHQRGFSFNENLSIKTEGFDQSAHRVKIVTTVVIGDLEVQRI